MNRISKTITWLLTANFFFVLASFAWFLFALLGRSLKLSWGLDVWYSLWQPLFSPAIGLLMGGAIVSGVSSWIWQKWRSFRESRKNTTAG